MPLILILVLRTNLKSVYQLKNLGILVPWFGRARPVSLLVDSLMGLFIKLLVMTLTLVCGVHLSVLG
jgi:hypothetical protein